MATKRVTVKSLQEYQQKTLLYLKFDIVLEAGVILIKDDFTGEVLKSCKSAATAKKFMKEADDQKMYDNVRSILEGNK